MKPIQNSTFNIQHSTKMGMIGLDRRFPLAGAVSRMRETSLNLAYQVSAKTTLAKAKSIVSPFFGVADFAPAYAIA